MIVFVHLLNDRSGSPRVLRHVMSALAGAGSQMLYVGEGGDGFLGTAAPDTRRYPYRRGNNRFATLLSYLWSQWGLWRELRKARDIDKNAIVYVNTLLPFAACLYGRWTGRRVICHLHEASHSPRLLQWFLLKVACSSAHTIICVSTFQVQALGLARHCEGVDVHVVPNALDEAMCEAAARSVYAPYRHGKFRVCMLCSLRDYKGVPEFLNLARQCAAQPHIEFQLVLSDGASTIASYFAQRQVPDNVRIVGAVADTAEIYAEAGLVLNLSRIDQCLETFGLTLLEAMAFGVPVIAPPLGGPAGLVDDGVHGYLIDSRDTRSLRDAVARMANDPALCLQLSRNCRVRAQSMSPEVFAREIRQAVVGL